MTNKKSASQLINEYEAKGTLSATDAQALRDAPTWSIAFADIAAYLGGSVVFVGLIWIVFALMQDLTEIVIDVVLFIVSGATAALAFWLSRKGGKKQTLSEFVTAFSATSFAIGVGLLLDIVNVDDDLVLIIASSVALAIGVILIAQTAFVGTVIVVVATQPLMAGVISKFFTNTSGAPLIYVVSGFILLWFAQRKIGLRFLARGAGAVSVMFAAIAYSTQGNDVLLPAIGLLIVGLLFAYGSKFHYLDAVIGGGLGVTTITGILAGRLSDSALVQGIAIITAGLSILFVSFTVVKKSKRIL